MPICQDHDASRAMVLQGPAAIRVEILPPKGTWKFNLRWNRHKEDIGELWSKIQRKLGKKLLKNGPEDSEIMLSSSDGSLIEDEDDLLSFIENAVDDGEDRIQLRAINVEVQIDHSYTLKQTDIALRLPPTTFMST